VHISQEMLEVLERFGARQKERGITGDECWIYSDNYHIAQWTPDHAAVSPRIRATLSSKKIMISAYFTREGLFPSKHFQKQNDSIPHSSL
jgi:hypothetical protein